MAAATHDPLQVDGTAGTGRRLRPHIPELDELDPGEPYFVLRGRDMIAFPLVAVWIQWALRAGVNRDKLDSATRVFEAMRDYPAKRMPD